MVVPLVAGCATGKPKTDCPNATGEAPVQCITKAEPYPKLIAAGADVASPIIGRVAAHVRWRPGYIAHQQDAKDYLQGVLRPLDVVLVSSKSKATHRLLPGEFVHVAVYLGDRRELEQLGVWEEKVIRARAGQIENGAVFVEADVKGVHLSSKDRVFNTDHVVVLRPSIRSSRQRRDMILKFHEYLGSRFDYHFNADNQDAFFCAELADHVLTDQGFPKRKIYGRTSIVPDEIIAAALSGQSRLRFVTYVKGAPESWKVLKKSDLGNLLRSKSLSAQRSCS